ncbi:MAG: hypothetical protein COA78_18890 [Blastopirellula sp.]|nr:MAG: hypothetical protein COA78_18890 [Blastopirellula sp.]
MKIDNTCSLAVKPLAKKQRTNKRHGFTLVELLVVITIIGILAGLALVGISSAVTTGRETAMAFELGQIEMALQSYKTDMGSFPPDSSRNLHDAPGAGKDVESSLNRHLNRKFTQRRSADKVTLIPAVPATNMFERGMISRDAPVDLNDLGPSETYVLLLMGFSPDVERPLTGPGERNKRFEFKAERLIDPDNDGWYSYKLAYSESEIVYFKGGSYAGKNPQSGNQPEVASYTPALGNGIARPYANKNKWANEDTFQLISTGLDEDFGEGFADLMSRKSYPSGLDTSGNLVAYTLEDRDNITNFAGTALRNREDD